MKLAKAAVQVIATQGAVPKNSSSASTEQVDEEPDHPLTNEESTTSPSAAATPRHGEEEGISLDPVIVDDQGNPFEETMTTTEEDGVEPPNVPPRT